MAERDRTVIIAEAGVNHNGDIGIAMKMVDCAASAGADYVKFQTFKADNLASASAKKAEYQKATTDSAESQLEMLQRLELTPDMHRRLIKRCDEAGIAFLSSAFDLGGLAFLSDDLGLKTVKLGSGELTNGPLLLSAARSGMKLMLSTGMGSLAEVEEALGVIAFGLTREGRPSGRPDFADVLLDPAAWEALRDRVTLMHCTTEYPAAVEDTNLRAIDTMRQAFGLPVGYSDHTEGNAMSIAAVARGASIIEKHFTLDRTLEGPDHAASIEPEELAGLVCEIRAVETGLGSGIKQPSNAEVRNRPIVRKSLHAARELAAGHRLGDGDLLVLRPGTGISPMEFWSVLGRETGRHYGDGEILDEQV